LNLKIGIVSDIPILIEGSIYIPYFDGVFYWEIRDSKLFKQLGINEVVGCSEVG